jgi:predicted lipid-binding transport protein (Tim44 family)
MKQWTPMSVRGSRLLAALAALCLVLSPMAADARLGGGHSIGSRGGRTWSAPPMTRTAPGGATPFERSLSTRPSPGYSGAGPMMSGRSHFMSGLLGGLLGAGIGGLLFGHGFFGHGMGFGGFIGFLIQIFLLVMIGRWLFRRFITGGGAAYATGPNMFARGAPMGGMMGGGGGSASPSIPVDPADQQAFEQLLQATQAAWSAGDLNALRGMATPEMVSYFAEQLGDLASRGHTNTVSDVSLQSGDIAQSWAEGDRQYATVAMRFSMIDVTRDAAGRIVDGSATEHVTATELWTFVRARGGQWILSAIQQAR